MGIFVPTSQAVVTSKCVNTAEHLASAWEQGAFQECLLLLLLGLYSPATKLT